jgi:hypothetical protein
MFCWQVLRELLRNAEDSRTRIDIQNHITGHGSIEMTCDLGDERSPFSNVIDEATRDAVFS